MNLSVQVLKSDLKEKSFNLFETLVEIIQKSGIKLENGDIIVISSKYVAISQGRIIDLNTVISSKEAQNISEKYHLNSKISEIILREADLIFGGVAGFVISSSDNILAPNAGIDKSNIPKGKIILYPMDPYQISENLRREFFLRMQIQVAILIIDSRLMPAKMGTTGVAIACSGIEPVRDLRGERDLHGNPLKVTFQAIADNLASIANLKMGEGSDSLPIAIIKNSGLKLTNRKINPNEMTISSKQCVFIRGLGTR